MYSCLYIKYIKYLYLIFIINVYIIEIFNLYNLYKWTKIKLMEIIYNFYQKCKVIGTDHLANIFINWIKMQGDRYRSVSQHRWDFLQVLDKTFLIRKRWDFLHGEIFCDTLVNIVYWGMLSLSTWTSTL